MPETKTEKKMCTTDMQDSILTAILKLPTKKNMPRFLPHEHSQGSICVKNLYLTDTKFSKNFHDPI